MRGGGSTPLVGRAGEQRELAEAFRAACEGRPSAMVLDGEPGVGKSRLLAEFLAGARDEGATVLRGACLDLGGGALPHLPLVEMLRGLVRRRGAARVRALADPAWPDLARVLPAIADGAALPPTPREGSPTHLLEAVLCLVEGCADEAPTVVAFEDLQWADQSTAELLAFLVRALADERVFIVCTCRTDDTPVLRALLSNLALSGRCSRRSLRPLDDAEIAGLVGHLVGGNPDPALVRWVVERAGGNAYYARELVIAGPSPDGSVPVGIRDLVQARLDAAGPSARQVASVVAAAGRAVAHPLVAAACGLPTAELLAGLRSCVAHGVLVVDATQRYAFRHALTLDAVYGELLPGERAACHLALAQTLAAQPALGLEERAPAAAELAHHWDIGGDLPRAFAASVAAASAASGVYGYAEAEQQYERAMRLWPAVGRPTGPDLPDLLAAAADAGRWAGHVDRALAYVDRGLDELGAGAGGDRRGALLERRGRYLWELGNTADSLRAYALADVAYATEPPSAGQAWALAGHATALVQVGQLREAVARCRAALRVAEAADATAAAGRARNTLGAALTMLGSPEEGIRELRVAVGIAEEGGNPEDVLRGHANLGYALEAAGRLEESLAATLEGVRRSRDLGLVGSGGTVLLANAASVLTMLGRWGEAQEMLESADNRRSPPGFDRYRRIVLAELEVGRGRFTAAEELLAPVAAASVGEPQLAGPVHALRAEALLWQAGPAAALAVSRRGVEAVVAGDDPGPVLRLVALGLRAVADVRDLGAAQEHAAAAAALWSLAEGAADGLLPAAAACRALCVAEHRRYLADDDPMSWAEVAAGWAELAQPYPAAYARWRQAEAMIAARNRVGAAEPLALARGVAARLGASPLLRAIDDVARSARLSVVASESPADRPAPTPFGLTPRERDVLALLVDGLSNRQIARRLFIAEKTAGVHVSNILGKMGVTSRGQAAAAARRAGMVGADL